MSSSCTNGINATVSGSTLVDSASSAPVVNVPGSFQPRVVHFGSVEPPATAAPSSAFTSSFSSGSGSTLRGLSLIGISGSQSSPSPTPAPHVFFRTLNARVSSSSTGTASDAADASRFLWSTKLEPEATCWSSRAFLIECVLDLGSVSTTSQSPATPCVRLSSVSAATRSASRSV
jgi:hypothetical protein